MHFNKLAFVFLACFACSAHASTVSTDHAAEPLPTIHLGVDSPLQVGIKCQQPLTVVVISNQRDGVVVACGNVPAKTK